MSLIVGGAGYFFQKKTACLGTTKTPFNTSVWKRLILIKASHLIQRQHYQHNY